MSHLKLFVPDDAVHSEEVDAEFPATIPFRPVNRIASTPAAPKAVDRARVLHENRQCPYCSHVNVEPIELHDSVVSVRNHRPIPGTATIVGFHCHSCNSEWPVYQTVQEERA